MYIQISLTNEPSNRQRGVVDELVAGSAETPAQGTNVLDRTAASPNDGAINSCLNTESDELSGALTSPQNGVGNVDKSIPKAGPIAGTSREGSVDPLIDLQPGEEPTLDSDEETEPRAGKKNLRKRKRRSRPRPEQERPDDPEQPLSPSKTLKSIVLESK